MICFFKFPLEDSLGGAEIHTLKLAEYFQEKGERVKLFTSDRHLFRLFEKNRLPRRRVFAGWEPTSKRSLLLWPLTYMMARFTLRRLLKQIPVGSTLFLQSLTEKLILTPISHKLKARIIWLEHKIPGRWLWLNPLKFRYLKLAKKVQVVTVSNFAKREFVSLGVPEEKIQVIYPGVLPANYQLPTTRPFTIGLLSRLEPEKGVCAFLEIIAPRLPQHSDWQILIAGEGNEKEKIMNMINKYNLGKQVHLLGFVNNLGWFFSQISVLVYPSLVPESFGVAVLEAQARGVPVVASKIGALSEIIEHGWNGFLIEKNGDWLEYLIKLRGPDLYRGLPQNSLASVRNFSEEKMFAAFLTLIKNDKLSS